MLRYRIKRGYNDGEFIPLFHPLRVRMRLCTTLRYLKECKEVFIAQIVPKLLIFKKKITNKEVFQIGNKFIWIGY